METVHHGSYRNVRVVELDPSAREEVEHMVRMCPYGAGKRLSPSRFTDLIQLVSQALSSGGAYSYGWVTWEVRK